MLPLKLAFSNLKKDFRSFAPFWLAMNTLYVIMFLAASIAFSKSLTKMNSHALGYLMIFALIVLSIFGLIISIYSYRFLQLQRAKTFGLYDILGFGKMKIVAVAFWELILSYLATVVIGSLLGIGLSKFIFLIFVNLIGGNYFNLLISSIALVLVAAIFLVLFLILLIIGSLMISKSSSLDLLFQAQKGEREPKSNVILAGLAIVLLVIGYIIAATVDNPVTALTRFFIAVLLVMAGTYFFYISATVWYLKWRKKRDSYYQPHNFITISSMLYRMKANAAGLANITILLTMSLVTIVVTVSMFVGTRQLVMGQYFRQAQITQINNLDNPKANLTAPQLQEKTKKIAEKAAVKISNVSSMFSATELMVERHPAPTNEAQTFNIAGHYGVATQKTTYAVTLTTAASLKSFGAKNMAPLTQSDVAIYTSTGNKNLQNLNWYGNTYKIKQKLDVKDIAFYPSAYNIARSAVIVFADDASLKKALSIYNDKVNKGQTSIFIAVTNTTTYFDIAQKDQAAFRKALKASSLQGAELSYRSEALQDQKASIGGFVFIGFVLGLSFILGAALIIYYKQLSEGAQDKRSFKILQEVGLSQAEVQKTIKTQVRMLFFLPIIVTVVHFAFAYNMIAKLVQVFGVTDNKLMLLISLATVFALALLYWLIYKLTSRIYYKIVERY